MKVSDLMQVKPVTVKEDRPVRDAVRLIFNLNVSAILVVRKNNLIGIITEEDILHKLFPSVRDFMEGYVRARSSTYIEERLPEIINKPIQSIMTPKPVCIAPEASIMRAQTKMLLNKFSHLPVVNDEDELVGIISQGDIFRALVGSEVPYDTQEEFHDWVSHHYDFIQTIQKRYDREADSLSEVFKKHNVISVLDVGCGTGGHVVELARRGYMAYGVEKSSGMLKQANKKLLRLPKITQSRVKFHYQDVEKDTISQLPIVDAVLFLGNALAHFHDNYKFVFKRMTEDIRRNGKLAIIQLVNYHKVYVYNKRLQNFTITQTSLHKSREYAFIEYYDPPRIPGGSLTKNMAVLQYGGKRWMPASVNSTPIANITPKVLESMLISLGAKHISYFGSYHGGAMFAEKFDQDRHDWLNAVVEF